MNAIATQTSVPSWGIDRIDQVSRPLSNSYDYKNTGLGVTAYIIDTGIKFDHSEFGLRASFGFDAFNGNGSDANGHGTHVSGTVGGNTMGVAKEISLVAVRVLDASGSGSTSGVAAGIDWAVNNHSNSPAVANMSLGGGASTVIDDAVKRAVSDGIVMCVAAGNSSVEAITVGATTSSDALASYSNYGSIVDILAPGSNITSSWNTSTIATNTISGTSMATPHVTGVAALYLQSYPSSKPSDVQNELISKATLGKISLSGAAKSAGTPNRLLFTNY
jgi:subtilisin family serine protease